MDKDVKDQLDRIEDKIDNLTNLIKDSHPEWKPPKRVSIPESRQGSKISDEELEARLDRLT